jgi:hypothetical protein
LISIVVDIAYNNPRTYPNCAALLSKFLEFLETDKEKKEIVEKIYKKFKQVPHTGHLKIWLQRATFLKIDNGYAHNLRYKKDEPGSNGKEKTFYLFDEKICKLVSSPKAVISLWNMDWISAPELKAAVNTQNIINRQGYTLALMQDLPKTKIPERRKLYIEKEGEQLKYIVKSPLDKIEEDYLALNIPELTAESLVLHKSKILAETSKRGHTNRKKALDEVSSVIPPEEIEYFLDDKES